MFEGVSVIELPLLHRVASGQVLNSFKWGKFFNLGFDRALCLIKTEGGLDESLGETGHGGLLFFF